MADRPIVALEQAWVWQCPDCAAENFVKSVPVESLSEQPEDVIRAVLDLEPHQPIPDNVEGEFVTAPECVMCRKCGKRFDCFDDVSDQDGEVDGLRGSSTEIPDVMPDDF